MDAVLPRAPSGRPRVAAVGAILVLCLLGAPLMSLFPVGVWEISHALAASSAGLGILLLAPVVVGAVLLMFWLSMRWLEGAGVNHAAASAALVTGTALFVPLFIAFLAPFPGQGTVLSAVLAGVVSTLGMGVCMVLSRPPRRRQLGVLPGLGTVAVVLLLLPVSAEHLRDRAGDEFARTEIVSFRGPMAVLDHSAWALQDAHAVQEGLRLTYQRANGHRLYVLTWHSADIDHGCDFPDVRCREIGGAIMVEHSDGRPSELRTYVSEDTLASVVLPPGDSTGLSAAATALRLERPGERVALIESLP